MQIKSAIDCQLDRLYHYQAFNNTRLRRILKDRTLYFSNPADFNDPWDCRPWFDHRSLDDPQALQRHLEWAKYSFSFDPNVSESEARRRLDVLQNDPIHRQQIYEDMSQFAEATISQRCRVFCVSSQPNVELMWSHYANKHQGICLEFSVANDVFRNALKVHYATDYPSFDFTWSSYDDTLATLLTKSNVWEYEDEYRVIASERGVDPIVSRHVVSDKSFVKLPEHTLKAIIFGCMVTDTTISAVKLLVKQSGQPISLRRAVRMRNQYMLEIVDL